MFTASLSLCLVLRLEWRYHTRRLTFAVPALALVFIRAFFCGCRPGAVDVDSPAVVVQALGLLSLGLLSLVSVFVLTFFCADAALQEGEYA